VSEMVEAVREGLNERKIEKDKEEADADEAKKKAKAAKEEKSASK